MTIFVNGLELGATSGLPTATGADEVPVSTGAGTTYVASPATAVVAGVIDLVLGSAPVGTALISDGVSGATTSSTAVASVLAAADLAAMRAALALQDMARLVGLSASAQSTVSTTDVAIGGARFDPADYSISGRTTTLTLEAIGQVVSGVTGTLTLYNVTDSSTAATLTWTETVATRKTASVTLPAAAKIYELRLNKSGGGASDYALVYGVNLLISWS